MVRAFFLAIGFCLMILGLECLGVEKAVLAIHESPPPSTSLFEEAPTVGPNRVVSPSDWLPWGLLATGAIVCIYSFTIPSRVKGK